MSQDVKPLPPANVHAMKGILQRAKGLMNVVESGQYQTGSIDPTSIDGGDPEKRLTEADLMASGKMPQAPSNHRGNMPSGMGGGMNPSSGNYEQAVKNSRLPNGIKEAMLKNPIPQANPYAALNNTFSLDDVSDLIEEDAPVTARNNNAGGNNSGNSYTRTNMNSNRGQQHQGNQNMIAENMVYTGSKTITINEDELRGMLKEMVRTEVAKFKKQLTEATIQRTIQTLIKEGKIAVKKKPRQKRV